MHYNIPELFRERYEHNMALLDLKGFKNIRWYHRIFNKNLKDYRYTLYLETNGTYILYSIPYVAKTESKEFTRKLLTNLNGAKDIPFKVTDGIKLKEDKHES